MSLSRTLGLIILCMLLLSGCNSTPPAPSSAGGSPAAPPVAQGAGTSAPVVPTALPVLQEKMKRGERLTTADQAALYSMSPADRSKLLQESRSAARP